MDLPKDYERKELLKLYANKYLKVQIGDSLLTKLVNITEGFASSDIEAVLRNLAYKLIANNQIQLTENLLIDELSKVVSLSKTNPEKINEIRAWGKERAVKASK